MPAAEPAARRHASVHTPIRAPAKQAADGDVLEGILLRQQTEGSAHGHMQCAAAVAAGKRVLAAAGALAAACRADTPQFHPGPMGVVVRPRLLLQLFGQSLQRQQGSMDTSARTDKTARVRHSKPHHLQVLFSLQTATTSQRPCTVRLAVIRPHQPTQTHMQGRPAHSPHVPAGSQKCSRSAAGR